MDVAADVLAVLSAAEIQGSSLMLTGQLDRKLYERHGAIAQAAYDAGIVRIDGTGGA